MYIYANSSHRFLAVEPACPTLDFECAHCMWHVPHQQPSHRVTELRNAGVTLHVQYRASVQQQKGLPEDPCANFPYQITIQKSTSATASFAWVRFPALCQASALFQTRSSS
jgi:hypothetical protein